MHLKFYNRKYLNSQWPYTFFILWPKKGKKESIRFRRETKERSFVNIFIPPLHSRRVPKSV